MQIYVLPKKGKFWYTDFIHLGQIRLYIYKKKCNKTVCISYRTNKLRTKVYLTSFYYDYIHMHRKLLGIISVSFEWTDRKEREGQSMWHMWGWEKKCTQILVEKPKGKRQLGRLKRRRNNNIKNGLSIIGIWAQNVLIWPRRGAAGGFCKCSNKLLVSIKYGDFLDWLKNC